MAIYGSHLRFALDVKDYFKVDNLDQYLSGSIYPDSRYFSKIDRHLTHNKDFKLPDFYQDSDFKKGWSSHIMYDNIQYQLMAEAFGYLLVPEEHEYGSNNWIIRTTLKILQDLDDIQQFDLAGTLASLEYMEAPHNESLEIIKKYNNAIAALYKKRPLAIEEYLKLWHSDHMNSEVVNKLRSKFFELEKDEEVMEKIKTIYPKSLEIFKSKRQG